MLTASTPTAQSAVPSMKSISRSPHALLSIPSTRSSRPSKPNPSNNSDDKVVLNVGPTSRQLTQSQSDPGYIYNALDKPKSSKRQLSRHVLITLVWVLCALTVAISISFTSGRQRALEFLTGYIVEYSLSIDNLFVFLLIFNYFNVPKDAQQSVLHWGIFGAMLLRGIMIVCGKALFVRFEWIALAFAALLLYSAVKLLLEDDDDDQNLESNRIIRFSKKVLPITDRYVGNRFIVWENSRLFATPLLVVLIAIELSDVVFALDSVPAVLGISNDTFVIYTSNILAIMGLRSLFFVLSTTIGNLRFLKQALSIVLGFIGIKMIASFFGYNIGIVLSLFIVAATLLGGVVLSILLPKPQQGSLSASSSDNNLSPVNSV